MRTILAIFLICISSLAWGDSAQSLIQEGDKYYEMRHQGGVKGTSSNIEKALGNYQKAFEMDPNNLEARWKFLRANYYKGVIGGYDTAQRREIFAKSKTILNDGLKVLADKVKTPNLLKLTPSAQANALKGEKDIALGLYYWGGVSWGEWSLAFGKMNAVMQGAAGKIKNFAEVAMIMNSSYEEGGPYRLLGRLHHQTPRVPMLTGWASNDEAKAMLENAVKTGPHNKINRYFYAEVLYDTGNKDKAKEEMTMVISEPIRSFQQTEEEYWKIQAQDDLNTWK